MHPIIASRNRLGLYLAVWMPAAMLVAIEFATVSGLPWLAAAAMAGPLALAYAFVCLAAWYPCRATPLQTSGISRLIGTHGAAAVLSSGLWIVLASVWARLLAARARPLAAAHRHRGRMISRSRVNRRDTGYTAPCGRSPSCRSSCSPCRCAYSSWKPTWSIPATEPEPRRSIDLG